MYLNPTTLSNQSNPAPGMIKLTAEQEQIYLQYNGFVTVIEDGESENGYLITPDTEKWEAWKAEQPDPIEATRETKIEELSVACNTTINTGAQVQLSDGSVESFTYGLADQSNVSEMFNAVLLGATQYPYHANDDDCRMYSAQDIVVIYATLSAFKTGQTTYHNQLKRYTKALTTQEEIEAVIYGQELTGEYLDKYNELMAQAKAQLDNVLAKVGQTQALSN